MTIRTFIKNTFLISKILKDYQVIKKKSLQ